MRSRTIHAANGMKVVVTSEGNLMIRPTDRLERRMIAVLDRHQAREIGEALLEIASVLDRRKDLQEEKP